MPRIARGQLGGVCGHVLNRGNGRQTVFHDAEDYAAFLELIGLAGRRTPMRVVGLCLMPTTFTWCSGRGTTATCPGGCNG